MGGAACAFIMPLPDFDKREGIMRGFKLVLAALALTVVSIRNKPYPREAVKAAAD